MDELLAEAAKAMGFNAYNVPGGDIMDLAKKLPTGRLYATGKRFVPNIKSSLYSLLIVTLAGEPQATLLGKDEPPRAAIGLPKNWDEIAARRPHSCGGRNARSLFSDRVPRARGA
jgi:hypothetical protein